MFLNGIEKSTATCNKKIHNFTEKNKGERGVISKVHTILIQEIVIGKTELTMTCHLATAYKIIQVNIFHQSPVFSAVNQVLIKCFWT